MKNEIYLEHYFPSPIFFTENPDFKSLNKQLEKDIYAWSERQQSMERSNSGGWHSPSNMNDLPEFKDLFDYIEEQVDRIKTDGLAIRKDSTLYLHNAWANINKTNDYNVKHNHPHSNISGVYYVKVPDPPAKIWFHDPRQGRTMTELLHDEEIYQNRMDLWSHVHFVPTPGKLILFPSYLEHTVEQNLSQEDRISVSFNIVQVESNVFMNFKYS